MSDTYNCDYLQHSTFRFNLIDIHLIQVFLPNFAFFYRQITRVAQRLVSQENTFKKSKNPSPFFFSLFFRRAIGLNNSFTLIENNIWFLRYRSLNS